MPFSFEHRPKKESASERRVAEEMEMKRQAMEAAAKESTRARDLPPSTAPGLYSEMVAEAEQASRERRQVRRIVPPWRPHPARSTPTEHPMEYPMEPSHGARLSSPHPTAPPPPLSTP